MEVSYSPGVGLDRGNGGVWTGGAAGVRLMLRLSLYAGVQLVGGARCEHRAPEAVSGQVHGRGTALRERFQAPLWATFTGAHIPTPVGGAL